MYSGGPAGEQDTAGHRGTVALHHYYALHPGFVFLAHTFKLIYATPVIVNVTQRPVPRVKGTCAAAHSASKHGKQRQDARVRRYGLPRIRLKQSSNSFIIPLQQLYPPPKQLHVRLQAVSLCSCCSAAQPLRQCLPQAGITCRNDTKHSNPVVHAGKTTLVNYILSENHGKKIAVVENEFGEPQPHVPHVHALRSMPVSCSKRAAADAA